VKRGRSGAYRIDNNRLMFGDEELLSGSLFQLELFVAVLNAAKPRDPDLAPTLRALIAMTRDCSFACGPRLLADGTPLRLITPQRKPKAQLRSSPKRTLEAAE
jgi:hypothetical protein